MKRNKFPIDYEIVEGIGYCCGTFCIQNFEQITCSYYDKQPKEFKTFAEVFEKFQNDLDKAIQLQLSSDYPRYEMNDGSQIGYITLITKYGDKTKDTPEGQFPELLTYLLLTDWRVDREWVNSNTGNSLIQLSKEFTKEDVAHLPPIDPDEDHPY